MPLSTVQDSASDNGARTFSLDRLSNGRYNAIQVSDLVSVTAAGRGRPRPVAVPELRLARPRCSYEAQGALDLASRCVLLIAQGDSDGHGMVGGRASVSVSWRYEKLSRGQDGLACC